MGLEGVADGPLRDVVANIGQATLDRICPFYELVFVESW